MEIRINIPKNSSLEKTVKQMIQDKNEVHQALEQGNISAITKKGRKIVRIPLSNR
ncbi:MAG: hypothetical protein ACK4GN_13005 [Runella sp.]